ncbi:MAG: patatin-like phospholipase family protein [Solirubrobacteraceae bacterium]
MLRSISGLPTVHPVLRVILDRARTGSRPGRRDDDHVVCLAVEGGGMRGAVSAGMCVELEAAGLTGAFDRVYGVSAGALNGSCLVAGRAALGVGNYHDAATLRCINPWRALAGRPVIDFDFLFDDVITARRPLRLPPAAHAPEFRALATARDSLALRVLAGFADARELTDAVRASASLPALAGPPVTFRDEALIDGGLLEPIPVATARREGATHVLVLRSRPPGFRVASRTSMVERAALRRQPDLAALVGAYPDVYNRAAAELQRPAPDVLQVSVPDGTPLIGRLETSRRRVGEALGAGAEAMSALLTDHWAPAAHAARAGLAG